MKSKTYFVFRVDVWDSAANSILEHIAGIIRGRGGDLPGGGRALASGADHAAAGHPGGARERAAKARIEQAVTCTRLSAEQTCL